MLTWNEETITQSRPDGQKTLRWAELARVKILTTADGPLGDDFYYVLEGKDERSIVLTSHEDPGGLLERLQRLPGFDNEAFIRATMSAEVAEFLCWQAPASA